MTVSCNLVEEVWMSGLRTYAAWGPLVGWLWFRPLWNYSFFTPSSEFQDKPVFFEFGYNFMIASILSVCCWSSYDHIYVKIVQRNFHFLKDFGADRIFWRRNFCGACYITHDLVKTFIFWSSKIRFFFVFLGISNSK